MLPPQSEHDIAPHLAALRTLDPFLDIRWNPRARISNYGRIDAAGNTIGPTYDGRWEIWRVPPTGEAQRIVVVAQEGDHDGEYLPIDDRIVMKMRLWDRTNAAAIAYAKRLWAEHDQAREARIDEDGARAFFEQKAADAFGDRQWIGRGFAPQSTPTT